MANKHHVLLVEHESNDHDNIINMLQYFSYEVTIVNLAATAFSFLSNDKVHVDLVIANIHSPDSYAFQLLQLAVKMDILVILMSNIDDPPTTMMALEQGAFLCIEKPMTMQILEYLWQHVSREKLSRVKDPVPEAVQYNPEAQRFVEEDAEEGNIDILPKRKVNLGGLEHDGVSFKRKAWTEWTVELHKKFMDAARQLGPGRCYPKDILEIMNVPGLTRMQVASHLQKCRSAKWLPPDKRKQTKHTRTETKTREHKHMRTKILKFGSMPFVDEPNPQEFVVDTPPLPQPTMLGAGSSSNNGYPILDDGIMSLAAAAGGGTFDTGGLGFSTDEGGFNIYGEDQSSAPTNFTSNAQDAFELQMMDSLMMQNFSQGGMGYDESSWAAL